jgi:hypothetical protein
MNTAGIDVVLGLRSHSPTMEICVLERPATPYPIDHTVRVLRWTFRRDDESFVCELALNTDDSAYELRFMAPWNPSGCSTELFTDAMKAFQRHAAIERVLVHEGWMLEGFESQRIVRL